MAKKYKAFVFIVIGLVILALILFYFPLAITQPALEKQNKVNKDDDADSQDSKPETVKTPPVTTTPDSFSGLEKENKSLDDLNKLLEGF